MLTPKADELIANSISGRVETSCPGAFRGRGWPRFLSRLPVVRRIMSSRRLFSTLISRQEIAIKQYACLPGGKLSLQGLVDAGLQDHCYLADQNRIGRTSCWP